MLYKRNHKDSTELLRKRAGPCGGVLQRRPAAQNVWQLPRLPQRIVVHWIWPLSRFLRNVIAILGSEKTLYREAEDHGRIVLKNIKRSVCSPVVGISPRAKRILDRLTDLHAHKGGSLYCTAPLSADNKSMWKEDNLNKKCRKYRKRLFCKLIYSRYFGWYS